MKQSNNVTMKNGFTLIELILYIAIISIILSSLVIFAWNVIGIWTKNTTNQEVSSTARYVSERIKLEIRNALDINTASSNFDVNLATNPGTQLSLSALAPNNPTIIDVVNGQVRITQGTNSPVPLNSLQTIVTNLTFSNYSASDGSTQHFVFTLIIQSGFTSIRQEYKDTITIQSSAEIRSN